MSKEITPTISVLMSCYNASRWLQEAVNSVLEQTFNDFELILIDDGSRDNTWRLIKSCQENDERIVAISKKNTGLADSLNVGIKKAKGKWVARLDADDRCELTRLETQLNYVYNHPDIVLLGTGFFEINEQDLVVKKQIYPSSHRQLLKNLERSKRFFPHSSALYRTDVVNRIGGYNQRFSRAEDKDLWMRMALQGKIACLPLPLVRIRKHSAQISNDNDGSRQLYDETAATVCHFLRKLYYEDPSVAEEETWKTFICWIERRVTETDIFGTCKSWSEARCEYFNSDKLLFDFLRLVIRLQQSGNLLSILKQKWFGSSLSIYLAKRWIHRSRELSGGYSEQ